jgi:3-oxoacyl-[acyl-carrier protein] reductase
MEKQDMENRLNRFEGKNVIVTGAGSGFGAAIATRFASEGANVLLSDINSEAVGAVASNIKTDTKPAGCIETNVTNVAEEAEVIAMIEQANSAFGGIDVLVNNAGYSHLNKLTWKISVEDFDAVFAVNVRGVFLGCKHVIPVMIQQGTGGAIINIASIGSIAPRPGVTPYNATKGAVLTMTKGLALEVARNQIRVNAVNPVASLTGFMETATGVPAEEMSEEQKARLISTIPLGRMAEPTDVAGAVTFLASDDAVFLTGTSINVDGGRSV